jgi:hypothetical protein
MDLFGIRNYLSGIPPQTTRTRFPGKNSYALFLKHYYVPSSIMTSDALVNFHTEKAKLYASIQPHALLVSFRIVHFVALQFGFVGFLLKDGSF